MSYSLQSALAFALWASTTQGPVRAADVCERYGVSKRTAWRWLAALRSARKCQSA